MAGGDIGLYDHKSNLVGQASLLNIELSYLPSWI